MDGVVWFGLLFDTRYHQQQTEAAERAFHNLGMKPIPDKVAAEAARKAAVSFIIKRIQVRRASDGPLCLHVVVI